MLPQPLLQHRLAEGAGFAMAIDEGDYVVRLGIKPRTVEAEKNVHTGKGNALVAVTLVHGEAFPQRGLLDQIGMVAGRMPEQKDGKGSGFTARYGVTKLVNVECDGHAYHRATTEQISKDARRDRLFTELGIHVMRFSGKRIFHDQFRCAREVVAMFEDGQHTDGDQ